jgi:hypothetical protein
VRPYKARDGDEFVAASMANRRAVEADANSRYTSLESMFESALKFLAQHGLQPEFADRCHKLVRNAHDFGYGFGDQLEYMYGKYIEGQED